MKIKSPELTDVLTDEINKLREALQDLMDEQNGPLLIRDKSSWEAAMNKADKLLSNRDQKIKEYECPLCRAKHKNKIDDAKGMVEAYMKYNLISSKIEELAALKLAKLAIKLIERSKV